MRPQTDNAFVVGFGGEIKTWQTPTADPQQLTAAINRLDEPGWGTRVYDALYGACSGSLAAPSDGKSLHRAIILLTDGDDTDSLHSLADVIAAAQRSAVRFRSTHLPFIHRELPPVATASSSAWQTAPVDASMSQLPPKIWETPLCRLNRT
jgi:hypothetical protein